MKELVEGHRGDMDMVEQCIAFMQSGSGAFGSNPSSAIYTCSLFGTLLSCLRSIFSSVEQDYSWSPPHVHSALHG